MTASLEDDIHKAADILKRGGIAVYPTETVYGIGCDPMNADACRRIAELKGRDGGKPMLLLASSYAQVVAFAGEPDTLAGSLALRFWPGPLTLAIKPKNSLPPYLYGPSGGVAFRVTDFPEARLLADSFGAPVISTSANISGTPPVSGYSEAVALFGDRVDCVVGHETAMGGTASTLLDIAGDRPMILREGAVPKERIEEVLQDVLGY